MDGMNRKYYEDLFGKCTDCKLTVIAYPSGTVKHYSPDDLEQMLSDIDELGKTQDTYINMCPRVVSVADGKRGSAEDVACIKALYSDIDVKGEAHKSGNLFPSKDAAVSYIKSLEKQPTYLVDTGYGIDAVYILKQPYTMSDTDARKAGEAILGGWGSYMKREAGKLGNEIDNVFDTARMLRAPGTLNHKLDQPVESKVIEYSGVYYDMEDFEAYKSDPAADSHDDFCVDERTVGDAERILAKCQAVQHMLDEPNDISEPLWHALATNIVLAGNGPERFHEYSAGYDGYSVEETDRKIKYALEAKKPCTCEYICRKVGFSCPEGGCGVKAPVVHSLYTKDEQLDNLLNGCEKITAKDLLDDYIVDLLAYAKKHEPAKYLMAKELAKKGGIGSRDFDRIISERVSRQNMESQGNLIEFALSASELCLKDLNTNGAKAPAGYDVTMKNGVDYLVNEDGMIIPQKVCTEPLVISKRTENIDNGLEKYELVFRRNHKWKNLIVSRAMARNKNQIIRLADQGMSVSTSNAEMVVNYLSAYEAENSAVLPFVRSINRIGWMGDEFYPYVVDGEVLFEDDDYGDIVKSLVTSGDGKAWMDMAKELRKSPFARMTMDASFASPMLELLQLRVALIHIWHSSRSGKTATLKFGLSIWGDPMKLMGNFNSTAVGLERRAGTLKHLPLGLDELQVLNEKRLSPALIVYSLGNGFGKTRGAKNGGLQEVPTWRNVIISTGEQPLASENSMDGVYSRVLELYGQPVKDASYGRKVHQVSESNYGFAAKPFIEFLIEKDKQEMRLEFEDIRDELKGDFEMLGYGDPGAHLDTATVLALADWYSSMAVFGEDKDIARNSAIGIGVEILKNAKEQEKEDVVVRAYAFMTDWIAANRSRFEKHSTLCFGCVDETADKVYVIASEMKNALEEGGYSYTKCIKGFKERGFIDFFTDKDGVERTQCQKKIQGVNVRAVSFRMKVESLYPAEDDFLDQKIVPLTGVLRQG